jgi:deoxyribodipyrimidine photo-lyase
MEKMIQELAWRDYWQQVWRAKGFGIDEDLRQPQYPLAHHAIPTALLQASTGIQAVDQGIRQWYQTGYLHNHLRMYIAALACNIGRSHWRAPASWMYYHLLDADWASNALSWQWVAGTNSSKKYIANQENVNRYCGTQQQGTFLDQSYEALVAMPVPDVLRETSLPVLMTTLPESEPLSLLPNHPTFLYNAYNLDPAWHAGEAGNRILLLEPDVFQRYPMGDLTVAFMLKLAQNIPGIQVFAGSFDALMRQQSISEVVFKEHPLNRHYRGREEPRDWMFQVSGYFPSFFQFWKRCQRYLSA